jgi:peptidoglycan/LPS O-acetylase OafA/YrhL
MQRRHDIDALRIFAVYLLFVFHTAMVFNPAPFYHIRNDEQSMVMLVVTGFISLWHMPLLFVLAGWSLVGSLRARGTRGFLRERVRKLLIPLAAGCVMFGPVLKYFELRSGFDASMTGLKVAAGLQDTFRQVLPVDFPVAAPFHESFLEFWPTYFTLARFSWAHLWFIAYLFTFTVLYRPLFVRALARADAAPLPRSVRPVWVYAPMLPLALVQIVLRPYWPGLQNLVDDWANFAYYSGFVMLGFLLARRPEFECAVWAETRRAFGIALAATLVLLGAVLRLVDSEPLILAATAVAGWGFIVVLLGVAQRAHVRGGAGLAYLAESSFPIYILHQVGVVVTGFWIIKLPLGIATKFVLVLVAGVASTLAFYHFVVRRVPALRFALGMKAVSGAPRRTVSAALMRHPAG